MPNPSENAPSLQQIVGALVLASLTLRRRTP